MEYQLSTHHSFRQFSPSHDLFAVQGTRPPARPIPAKMSVAQTPFVYEQPMVGYGYSVAPSSSAPNLPTLRDDPGPTPSFQVTRATPTKGRRPRRSSAGQSIASTEISTSDTSLGSPIHQDSLDLMADPKSFSKDDDSAERLRLIEEEKKARARLKTRDRQRRKRERDRLAKEVSVQLGDTNGSWQEAKQASSNHLTIPRRPSRAKSPHLSVSVPSPNSYPPPNQSPFAFHSSFSTTPISGQSSPNAPFSPITPLSSTVEEDRRRPSVFALSAPPASSGPTPAKRRKSEPEPVEELGLPKEHEVGLGLTQERPAIRRSISDGAALPGVTPSTSPPPVPDVPRRFRKPHSPSEAGNYFASTIMFSLTSSQLVGALEQSLGVGRKELEEMKDALAAVYDQFRVERDMRAISLENNDETLPSKSTPDTPSQELLANSFFTPAPARTTSRPKHPNTMPLFSIPPAPQDSTSESPLAPQSTGMHSRNRSLSSANMRARGLVINPSAPPAPSWPDTPVKGKQDEAQTSPMAIVKTPSTAQSVYGSNDAPPLSMQEVQWQRRDTIQQPMEMDGQDWKGGLDSPIVVTGSKPVFQPYIPAAIPSRSLSSRVPVPETPPGYNYSLGGHYILPHSQSFGQ